MVSSQKSEDVAPAALSGGVPGTASNLPRPPARAASGASGASRRTEEISYQSSRVVRRVKLPQGELKRVSVSLLLDQDVRWEGKAPHLQQILIPPSAEKLKTIRDLVAGVINFKADRGDQLIVETLPFEATLHTEPPPPFGGCAGSAGVYPSPGKAPAWLRNPQDHRSGIAGGALLLLTLGAGVWNSSAAPAVRASPPKGQPRCLRGTPARWAPAALQPPGDSVEKKMQAKLGDQADLQARLEAEALDAIKAPAPSTNKKDILSKYLRESLQEGLPWSRCKPCAPGSMKKASRPGEENIQTR